eukprot:scaffold3065_cov389-Prasinococcus_capsulatus_cf.AAC.6
MNWWVQIVPGAPPFPARRSTGLADLLNHLQISAAPYHTLGRVCHDAAVAIASEPVHLSCCGGLHAEWPQVAGLSYSCAATISWSAFALASRRWQESGSLVGGQAVTGPALHVEAGAHGSRDSAVIAACVRSEIAPEGRFVYQVLHGFYRLQERASYTVSPDFALLVGCRS